MTVVQGRVLVVAGSDSGGGAGIQADIKAVTALGGYAATAVTALTAQNTQGVFGVVGVDADFVQKQMRLVLDDIGADAIKTGMLADVPVIEAVCSVLEELGGDIPIVVDPVMMAQSGDPLIETTAIATLTRRLLPHATLLTPNLFEAEKLLGRKIHDLRGLDKAAGDLLASGAEAVLVKGGHLEGEKVTDVLAAADGLEHFTGPRLASRGTHGTGCTLASAIATGLAQGQTLRDAVRRARAYVQGAIAGAPGFGRGNGPLDHLAGVTPFPRELGDD